ncbi:MAG: GTPase ObgE [bacterium]
MSAEKNKRQTGFMDFVRIYLKAGDGGDGCMSMRREKHVPLGGPDGGNGGSGGDIFCEADSDLNTLTHLAYHPHWKAPSGGNGRGKNLYGRGGENMTISVPVGTLIKRNGNIVADLAEDGGRVLLARGGRGGRGNASFKTHENTAPRISENGEPGEEITLELELKLLADVGLVGFPNSGKSTFISRVSAARPKIADYPFTTLHPSLGVVCHKGKTFVAADIPGLIEGAHEGRGLGDSFLKHISRTRLLLQLVDPQGFGGISPADSVGIIAGELEKFSPALACKPRFIAVNKADLPGADKVCDEIKKKHKKFPVFLISAVTGKGICVLLDAIIRALAKMPRPLPEKTCVAAPEGSQERRLKPAFRVSRTGDGVLDVEGDGLLTMLKMTHFSQPEALALLRKRFKIMGVDRALKRAGVQEGETVRVSGYEFEWTGAQERKAKKLSRRRR